MCIRDRISEALAKRLAQIVPRAANDENAQLAPFVDPQVAVRINAIIEQGLSEPGARDVTASYRDGERLVQWNNCSYPVSYTHLRAHETPEHLVCRLLL